MNVDSIFIWIFLHIIVHMDIRNLYLTIFGVILDLIQDRIDKQSFQEIFIGGSMRVL